MLLSKKSKIQKPQKRKNGGCSQKNPKFKNSKTVKTPKRGLRSEKFKISKQDKQQIVAATRKFKN